MVTYAIFSKGNADEGYLKKLSPFLGITDLGDTVGILNIMPNCLWINPEKETGICNR